ncbi:MAG: DUF2784 family protein [Bacteroidales bacterium]
MVYFLLDWFFLVLHSSLIVFNLFGWAWKPLRKANLITLSLTGFSWVGLGLFYGMGYCPLTDWHWRVLVELGETPTTSSYVAYLFQRILGITVSGGFANNLTLIAFLGAMIVSISLNVKDKVAK